MNKSKLIEANMKLVHYLINKYYSTYSNNEDVIQEGMVGLCYAAEHFDESRGKFSTYASKCILNNIRSYFRKNAKHNNVLSLDYEVNNDDGDIVSFSDLIVGEKDVDLSNLNFYKFYETIDFGDRYIVDNIATKSTSEIAKDLEISPQLVSKRLRKLRLKWRLFND